MEGVGKEGCNTEKKIKRWNGIKKEGKKKKRGLGPKNS